MYRFKKNIMLAISLILAVWIGLGVHVMHFSRLSSIQGERIFFLDSASSQGLRKEKVTLLEMGRVKGECVRFDIDANEKGMAERLAQEIADKFHAEILIKEEVCGVISFYGFTPNWTEKVFVEGKAINLHVAVNGGQCVVGTPIIFDGF